MTKKLQLIFFILGFVICLTSSMDVTFNWVPLNYELGLVQLLPFQFWIGLILMLFSVLVGFKSDSDNIFLIKLYILYIIIFTIPILFESNISHWDSLFVLEQSISLSDNSIDIRYVEDSYYFIRYTIYSDWPGFFIGGGATNIILGLNPLLFGKYFPFIPISLTFLSIVCFYKMFLQSSWFRYALFLYVLSNVWIYFHYSPQSLALPIGLFILCTLEKKKTSWSFIYIVFAGYLVISHPTTAIFILGIILTIFLLEKLFTRFYVLKDTQFKLEINTIILIPLMFTSWLLFQASITQKLFIPSFYEKLSNFLLLLKTFESQYSAHTSTIYFYGPRIRFYICLLFVLLCLISIVFNIYRKKDPKKILYLTSVFFSASMFLVLALTGFSCAFMDRVMLWIGIVAPLLIMLLFKNLKFSKKLINILCCLILILGALNCSALYYNANLHIISDSAIHVSEYISVNLDNRMIVGGEALFHLPVFYHSNISALCMEDINRPFFPHFQNNHQVIILDKYSELLYNMGPRLNPKVYDYFKRQTKRLSKIYSNGAYKIYF